jgi:hypothetical protein
MEWVARRPDNLIENDEASLYSIRSIFNAGKTSRINVAHFMVQLIIDTGI